MDRDIGENISQNVSSKYSHKLLDHAKQSATDPLKTASRKRSNSKNLTNSW